ncbi:hypothetical protein [Mesorhizobium sp.]|uniref:hypothetical protein n=1 Tax=Mesorhizobium sp. TaxID=1871066 RepID=UPI0025F491E4|nr:hypothetical protein [Mesorhizobium sp.]
MKGKLASVVTVSLALLVPGGMARALEYQLPSDPISPTSASECDEVYDQYSAIADQVGTRAKAAGDQAWAIVLQSGPGDPEAKSLYAQSGQLFDEASQIRSEGSAARLRCMKQVYAYQASHQDEQRLGSYGSPGKYAADLSGPVAKAAALNGIKTLDELGKIPPDLAIFEKVNKIGETVSDLSGRGGAGGYLSQLVGGVSDLQQWGPLRTFMVKNSLRELLAINSAATSALQSELSSFDSSEIDRMVSDARRADSTLLSGNVPASGSSGADTLSDEELEAYREHQGMYAGRGEAYEEAVASMQREYRKVVGRPASNGGGRSGTRYSATQCQQLLEQIQEYNQLLPQYSAAGQGAMIQMGINANQSACNRGCR